MIGEFKTCSGCKVVHYRSNQCQKRYWVEHKALCMALDKLTQTAPGWGDSADANIFVSHLTPKQDDHS